MMHEAGCIGLDVYFSKLPDPRIARKKLYPLIEILFVVLDIMNDPITISSGITYDRASLVDYFKNKGNPKKIKCPTTKFEIKFEELTNRTSIFLKNLIENFILTQEISASASHDSSESELLPAAHAPILFNA